MHLTSYRRRLVSFDICLQSCISLFRLRQKNRQRRPHYQPTSLGHSPADGPLPPPCSMQPKRPHPFLSAPFRPGPVRLFRCGPSLFSTFPSSERQLDSPLARGCQTVLTPALRLFLTRLSSGDAVVADMLLRRNADVLLTDSDDLTVFHLALFFLLQR